MATALQAAKALRRSESSKTVIRIDRVLGIRKDPPTPMSARAPISCHGSWASIATTEAPPNTSSPMTRKRRRPYRSDRLPAVSSRPAKTRT